jgi:hypothetical protein
LEFMGRRPLRTGLDATERARLEGRIKERTPGCALSPRLKFDRPKG